MLLPRVSQVSSQGQKLLGIKLSGGSAWGQPGKTITLRACRFGPRARSMLLLLVVVVVVVVVGGGGGGGVVVSGRGQQACRFGPRARIRKVPARREKCWA